MEDIKNFLDPSNFSYVWDLIITYGLAVIMAVVVLIIGLMVIKWIVNASSRLMERRNVDESLRPFLRTIIGMLLKIMLVISVIGMVGIETTSFIAVLGAAGLAIGMALSGTLQNFAGGVIILILKPFKVGDFIEGGGHAGTVREIQIFFTYMTTPSGQEIIIPNSSLSNDSITNYSFNDTRRFDMVFGIGYTDDIDKAKAILTSLAEAEERFLPEKGHDIFVDALADSSVNFHFRAWAKNSDFWDIHNNLPEKVKKAFDAEGINIPYPQMDVHIQPQAS